MRTARPARRGPMSTTGRSPACRRSPRAGFWRAKSVFKRSGSRFASRKRVTTKALPRIQPLALDADIHLALDIIPLLGRAQHADQLFEHFRMRGLELEPGQEVEGLAEVAAVIELAGDRGQVFQARRNVLRLVFKNLPPLFLRQLPPGRRFLDRDQR